MSSKTKLQSPSIFFVSCIYPWINDWCERIVNRPAVKYAYLKAQEVNPDIELDEKGKLILFANR